MPEEEVLISLPAVNVDRDDKKIDRLLALTNKRLLVYEKAFKNNHSLTFDDIKHITFCSKPHKKTDTFVIVFNKTERSSDG